MFEKDDLCEKNLAEMQKTVLMDSETIIRKVLSALAHFKLTEKIHHIYSVVKGATKLDDGPSISLYDLNWKYNYNLAIIVVIIIIIIIMLCHRPRAC